MTCSGDMEIYKLSSGSAGGVFVPACSRASSPSTGGIRRGGKQPHFLYDMNATPGPFLQQ
jgi:phosphoribosyl 1,2-cyclic phosphodiesterase